MANITNIPSNAGNWLPDKNIVEYKWVRFLQANKITKKLMTIFFNNPILPPMQKYLTYKNMDKIKAWLTELPYDKIT